MKRLIESKDTRSTLTEAVYLATQMVEEIEVIEGVIECRLNIAREDGQIVVRSTYVVEAE